MTQSPTNILKEKFSKFIETETKILGVKKIKKKLKEMGAQKIKDEVIQDMKFEIPVNLDPEALVMTIVDEDLAILEGSDPATKVEILEPEKMEVFLDVLRYSQENGCLIKKMRLRQHALKTFITLKGPKVDNKKTKERGEIEVLISDVSSMSQLLMLAGCKFLETTVKRRKTYVLPEYPDMEIVFDDYHGFLHEIKEYIEIEGGSHEEIVQFATEVLGIKKKKLTSLGITQHKTDHHNKKIEYSLKILSKRIGK